MKLSIIETRILKKRIILLIHPKDVFHRILVRERCRSIRNGTAYSMLEITVPHRLKNKILLSFIQKLKKEVRFTDAVGWLDKNHIGVLLPDTPFEGASAFLRKLETGLAPHEIVFDFAVYTYPENHQIQPIDQTPDQSSDVAPDPSGLARLTGQPIPFWKRALDITGSLLALILLCPLLTIIAIFIKCVSPGPIFFKQERLGYACKPFVCWKFRTMSCDTDPEKHKAHVSHLIQNKETLKKLDDQPDSGIIPLGNILRKSGLDELPQLFNVIRGDMSLIGPRPCIVYEATQFAPWQHRRFDTHPGLTGLWQVSGKNKTTFEEMMRLDIKYGQKRSLMRDTAIFFKTFPAVINQIREKKKNRG